MSDETIPTTEQPPTEQPASGLAAETELQIEVKKWQASLSALTLQIEDLKTELSSLPPGQAAEVAAIQDQIKSLTIELQDTRQELATAKEDLSQMRQLAQSVGDGNPTPATVKAGSSAPTAPSEPKLTRASKLGWV